ncbi:MAG: hypothetical protein IPK30_05045 [Cellvibrionales bacterium]|nr:hypothetical protein [Cellvibrionales bacterium]
MKPLYYAIIVIIEVAILAASSFLFFIAGAHAPRLWEIWLCMLVNFVVVIMLSVQAVRRINRNRIGEAIIIAILSLPVGIAVALIIGAIESSIFNHIQEKKYEKYRY